MKEIFLQKLHAYILQNNPDLLLELEEQGDVTNYLMEKIALVGRVLKRPEDQHEYIFEEICMNLLTIDLRPSRFQYIRNILEEEFENDYGKLIASGIMPFEVSNMVNHCRDVFHTLDFTEANEDSPVLRYAIMGSISEYLENVKSELQQATKVL